MKKRTLLAAIVTINSYTGFCQNIAGNIVAGVASGTLVSGTNLVNVDLYTGIGTVSIPIYKYSVDNVGFDISLTYNAKGITVNELASSVGLGWNIQAGGSITREVRGIEDEVTLPTRFQGNPGWQYSWGFVPGSCGTQTCFNYHDTLQGILVPDALAIGETLNQGSYPRYTVYDDQESDLFHFSVGGKNFSFAFRKTDTGLFYYTFPKTEVKIEVITRDYSNQNYDQPGIPKNSGHDSLKNMITFVITDENGNKYFFERGDYQIKEFELDSVIFTPHKGTYFATQTWILDHVVTATGKVVTFHYLKKYHEYLQVVTETFGARNEEWNQTNDTILVNPLDIKDIIWKGYKHHISQIDYPDGLTAYFDVVYGTQDRCDCKGDFRLKKIKLEAGLHSYYKHSVTYNLNQAYFNTPKGSLNLKELGYAACSTLENSYLTPWNGFTTQALKDRQCERGLRLKLKSITKTGTDGATSLTEYEFEYNQTALPYRFGPGQDYYGYYNGDTSIPLQWVDYQDNTVLSPFYLTIPYHTQTGIHAATGSWGAWRGNNSSLAQAFSLTRVKNGLGGQDSIVYVDYHLDNSSCPYGDTSYASSIDGPIVGCSYDTQAEGDTVNDGLVVGKIISTDKFSEDLRVVTEYTYKKGERFFRGGYMSYPWSSETVYTNYFIDSRNTVNGSNHGFDTVIVTKYGYNDEWLAQSSFVFSNLMYLGESSIYKPTGTQFRSATPNMRKFRMGLPLLSETYDELGNIISREVNTYELVTEIGSIFNRYIYNTTSPPPPPSGGLVHCWTDNGHYNYMLLDNQRLRIIGNSVTRLVKGPGVSTPKSITTSYSYVYDHFDNIKSIAWTDSKGDTFKKFRFFNYDYLTQDSAHIGLSLMSQKNMQYLLSSEVWRMNGSDSVLLNFELLVPGFNSAHDKLRFPATFTSVIQEPLSSMQVFPSGTYSTYVNRGAALNFTSNTSFGSNLEKSKEYTLYDSKENVLETKINDQDMFESYIWDTHIYHKVADVKNARYQDIAYCGFESTYAGFGLVDDNRGNWWFDPAKVMKTPFSSCANAATGNFVYELTQLNDNDSNFIRSNGLNNISFTLTYWLYNPTSSATVQTKVFNGSTSTGTVTMTLLNNVGNWKLYGGTFTPGAGNYIKIKNYGTAAYTAYIDEVRLYPTNATMTTTAYKPFFGPGSSCGADNYISHIEYDAFGRAMITRDMRGNIILKNEIRQDHADPNTSGSGSSLNSPSY